MPNKRLRIVLVDTDESRLIHIEKLLNRLGYFSILPIRHFDDLRALDHDLVEPFDVMIADKGLVGSSDINSNLFRQVSQKIDYVLLYDNQKTILGGESIRRLMARIDPASSWECLKDLTWIKYKNNTRHNYPT